MAAPMKKKAHETKNPRTLKTSKETLMKIRHVGEQILKDAENSNDVIWLMEKVHNAEKSIVTAAIRSLHKVFIHFLKSSSMSISSSDAGTKSAEHKFKLWLQSRYKDCIGSLAELISERPKSAIIQELAVCTLMKFLEAECKNPLKETRGYHFQTPILAAIVPHLLSKRHDKRTLIKRFQEYLEFDDVQYHMLYQVGNYLGHQASMTLKEGELEVLCSNTMSLLELVSMPSDDDTIENFLGKAPGEDDDVKVMSRKEHRKAFSCAWLAFLRLKLPSYIYKHVLVILHEDVMPHMHSPVLLTDFLTASYNVGGVISLLALNGLFFLINKYNLEYPGFYKKLYSLFDSTVFHAKYKARFFQLAGLFLSSTHLPSYLVAAFAKRLSRLSLTAPPHSLQLVIPFIINLIVRHPSCEILLHRPDGPAEFESDPYLFDEPDPAKSQALQSSLWEIDTLKSHYHPCVASCAKRIQLAMPKIEEDITESLESEVSDLVSSEMQRKIRTVPLEFYPVKILFGGKDEKFSSEFWSVK